MKKIYALTLMAGLASISVFSQTSGYTTYMVSVPGATITTSCIRNESSFVIDNTGNKWIGFNYGNANSFQLIRFNGTQWDTFPAFNALSPTNKVN
ncbi:MAG TPA: hypothetical protein VKG26_08570, partial [Bacteroidia bacterium]|nr:hypothetical protein [Bacteroidia bacterium]